MAERLEATPVFDGIFVLGSGIEIDDPTYEGKIRTLAGLAALKYGFTEHLVFSGGYTSGSQSEAEVMHAYLQEKAKQNGLERTGVIFEEKVSKNTAGNVRYAKQIAGFEGWRRVGVITHEYHLPRALQLAKTIGFQMHPLSAEELSVLWDSQLETDIKAYKASSLMKVKKLREVVSRTILRLDPQGQVSTCITSYTRRQ